MSVGSVKVEIKEYNMAAVNAEKSPYLGGHSQMQQVLKFFPMFELCIHGDQAEWDYHFPHMGGGMTDKQYKIKKNKKLKYICD